MPKHVGRDVFNGMPALPFVDLVQDKNAVAPDAAPYSTNLWWRDSRLYERPEGRHKGFRDEKGHATV